MSLRSAQQVGITGTVITTAAVTTSDTFNPDDRACWEVSNASGSPINVTVVVPGAEYGQSRADVVTAVADGVTRRFGPLVADLADPSTGLVTILHSSATSVTGALVRV